MVINTHEEKKEMSIKRINLSNRLGISFPMNPNEPSEPSRPVPSSPYPFLAF